MSTISASTTSTTAYKVTADTTGALVLQTGATPTTAVTIDTSQNVLIGGASAQTGAVLAVTGGIQGTIKSGTAVASTSGTSIDFTGIPSWVKRITVMFNGVSTNGISQPQVQLGDSGGIETTGYVVTGSNIAAVAVGSTSVTSGFMFGNTASQTAANTLNGSLILTTLGSNIWVGFGCLATGGDTRMTSGSKTTSDVLDRVRITTVNGTDTFDAGSINILYEG